MKKISLLFAAVLSIYALPACSDKPDQTSTADIAENMMTIDMVATHAIDTEMSVAQLTFVPNSVAPWLGRIILLDDDGYLHSTDIEGRAPKSVGTGKYIDIFGLARDKAAGVFLAITEDNKIEAFIESDDDGNFSPMVYAGKGIDAKAFCFSKTSTDSTVRITTTKSRIVEINLLVQDNVVEQLTAKEKPKSSSCFDKSHHANTAYFGSEQTVNFALSPNKDVGLTILDLGKPTLKFKANIKNGLSIGGVEHVKYITITEANYGAGGYDTGVLALVDADANRIVFISLSYAERQLLKAVNQPPNSP